MNGFYERYLERRGITADEHRAEIELAHPEKSSFQHDTLIAMAAHRERYGQVPRLGGDDIAELAARLDDPAVVQALLEPGRIVVMAGGPALPVIADTFDGPVFDASKWHVGCDAAATVEVGDGYLKITRAAAPPLPPGARWHELPQRVARALIRR